MAMLANQTGKRMGNMGAARANCPRRVLLPMLLAVGLLLVGCGRGATPTRVPQVVPTPVGALVGSLEDESRDLPDAAHWLHHTHRDEVISLISGFVSAF